MNARLCPDFELLSDYALRNASGFREHIELIESYGTWALRIGRSAHDLGVDRVITTTSGDLWTVHNMGTRTPGQ